MEVGKQRLNSFLYIYDASFRKLVEDFLLDLQPSDQVDAEQYIDFFYQEWKKDKELFSRKGIRLDKLQLKHYLKIQTEVELLTTDDRLENSVTSHLLNILSKFCTFLTNKEITRIYYRPPQKAQINLRNSPNNYPILSEFDKYMSLRHYSAATIRYYKTSVKHFLRNSAYDPEIQHRNHNWRERITQYEKYLSERALSESITLNTAYAYLKAVKLFTCLLYERKEINFRYNIPPEQFFEKGKRSNEYANVQDILLVCDHIFSSSNDVLRDMSIFLIILETGCRPIEVTNLNIDDVNILEQIIILKSIKSGQRTLSIRSSIPFIKDYLIIRGNYHPQNSEQALFISRSGSRMDSRYITHLFRKFNLKAFNEIRFTPKTLRHSFITNALNNDNNPEQVREVVGHKHSISTQYYFFRDINELKKVFDNKKLF